MKRGVCFSTQPLEERVSPPKRGSHNWRMLCQSFHRSQRPYRTFYGYVRIAGKCVFRCLTNRTDRRSFPTPIPARGITKYPVIAPNGGNHRGCQLLCHTLRNDGIAVDVTARLANPDSRALGFLGIVGASTCKGRASTGIAS